LGKKRRGRRGDERAVALVLVLAALTLMSILVVDFQDQQPLDLKSAEAERDALQAEYMARSGVNLTRLFIAAEPLMRQQLGILKFFFKGGNVPQLPVWEFSDQVLGAFSDAEGQKAFAGLGGFDIGAAKNLGGPPGARFSVHVAPEDDKINVNLGARGNAISENRFGIAFLGLVSAPSFDPLFERNDRDGNTSDRATICGAIMDWSDPDEQLYPCQPRNFQGGGAAGGEDQSYQLLARPYRVKNAPYDSLEELHLVRGVGDDFWATFVDPSGGDPKKRVMTVWGPGAVNVNTAAPQVIVAMICGLAPEAVICTDLAKNQQFLTMFGVLRTFTSGMPLFGTPNDFVATIQGGGAYGKLLFETLGIPPVRFQSPAEAAKNFTTESKVFSIVVTGVVEKTLKHTDEEGNTQEKVLSHAEIKVTSVVDFRGAPNIPNSAGGLPGANTPGIPGMPGSGGVSAATAASNAPQSVGGAGGAGNMPGAGVNAIAGALAASPAGTVVYYRIE
jgi:general secretion pathway protein K